MGSPWTGSSPFRVVMFINMGRTTSRIGTATFTHSVRPERWRGAISKPQALYLARVRKNAVAEYDKYEYLAALEGGRPSWSPESPRAIPLAWDFHARDRVGDIPRRHWPLLVSGGRHGLPRMAGSTWHSLRCAESMGTLEVSWVRSRGAISPRYPEGRRAGQRILHLRGRNGNLRTQHRAHRYGSWPLTICQRGSNRRNGFRLV